MNAAVWISSEVPPLVSLLEQEFRRNLPHDLLARIPQDYWRPSLLDPLCDFLNRPGKQFRGKFLQLSWELAGKGGGLPAELPLIIEALHAGSLIIDDIEDGSAYRRGAPALHIKYGLPIALNAGNWLYFWAFALVERLSLPPATELALHRMLNRTLVDCHAGQALDIATPIGKVPRTDIPHLVLTTTELKTGRLCELAMSMGALVAGSTQSTVRTIGEFGRELGVALQMLDDWGGIHSERLCHKGHEDLLAGRPTWPWAWLAERTSDLGFVKLQRLHARVTAADEHPEELSKAMREGLGDEPRAIVSIRLKHALSGLKSALGESRALHDLEIQLKTLEHSYE